MTPDKLKQKVCERDGYKCVVCGSDKLDPPHHNLQKSESGKDEIDNLFSLCYDSYGEEGCHYLWHHKGLSFFIDRVIRYHGFKKTAQAILRGLIK